MDQPTLDAIRKQLVAQVGPATRSLVLITVDHETDQIKFLHRTTKVDLSHMVAGLTHLNLENLANRPMPPLPFPAPLEVVKENVIPIVDQPE